MNKPPVIGDRVHFDGKIGYITALVDRDGVVDDPKDAIAITIQWDSGEFSAVLVSDLEYHKFH